MKLNILRKYIKSKVGTLALFFALNPISGPARPLFRTLNERVRGPVPIAWLLTTSGTYFFTVVYNKKLTSFSYAMTTLKKPLIISQGVMGSVLIMVTFLDLIISYRNKITFNNQEDGSIRVRIVRFSERTLVTFFYLILIAEVAADALWALEPIFGTKFPGQYTTFLCFVKTIQLIPFLNTPRGQILYGLYKYIMFIRNSRRFSYFVRYHVGNLVSLEVLTRGILVALWFVQSAGRVPGGVKNYRMSFMCCIFFLLFLSVVGYSIFAALFGTMNSLPLLDESIRWHIGENKDNKNNPY